MAPEQAAGKRATGATDVWSAGLTLYATLAGRNPYKARSLSELLENLGHRAPPLRRVRPELPRELSDALERAMLSNPERRPTAAEFRDMLLAAIVEPSVTSAPGWSPVAAPAQRDDHRAARCAAPARRTGRDGGSWRAGPRCLR